MRISNPGPSRLPRPSGPGLHLHRRRPPQDRQRRRPGTAGLTCGTTASRATWARSATFQPVHRASRPALHPCRISPRIMTRSGLGNEQPLKTTSQAYRGSLTAWPHRRARCGAVDDKNTEQRARCMGPGPGRPTAAYRRTRITVPPLPATYTSPAAWLRLACARPPNPSTPWPPGPSHRRPRRRPGGPRRTGTAARRHPQRPADPLKTSAISTPPPLSRTAHEIGPQHGDPGTRHPPELPRSGRRSNQDVTALRPMTTTVARRRQWRGLLTARRLKPPLAPRPGRSLWHRRYNRRIPA